MRHNLRRGITLIDVMMVVALVGVLVMLVLPALQTARAAARRASCTENLRQIGLGLHNYQSVWAVLPMSQVRGEGRGNGHGVFTLLLPLMEQVALYNGYNFWLENYDITNQTSVRSRVAAFLCPDNPNVENIAAADVRFPVSRSSFAGSHYGANWGGGHGRWNEAAGGYRRTPPPGDNQGPWGDDFAKNRGIYLGVMMTVTLPDGQKKGADGRPRARSVSLKDIKDGSSFTVAFVEKRESFGWAVGGWAGSEFDVHTAPAYDGDNAIARKVYTGSTHPDGPNALLCDGSVRQLERKQAQAIWYALITRAGGDAVGLTDDK